MHPSASAMLRSPDSVSRLDSQFHTMPAFQTGIQTCGARSVECAYDSSVLSEDNPFRHDCSNSRIIARVFLGQLIAMVHFLPQDSSILPKKCMEKGVQPFCGRPAEELARYGKRGFLPDTKSTGHNRWHSLPDSRSKARCR